MIPVSMLCLSIAWSPKLLKLQVHAEVSSNDYRRVGTVKVRTARNRITLITAVLKSFFTILFSFGLNYFANLADNSNSGISVYNGFMHFADDSNKFVQFFVQVCFIFGLFDFTVGIWVLRGCQAATHFSLIPP